MENAFSHADFKGPSDAAEARAAGHARETLWRRDEVISLETTVLSRSPPLVSTARDKARPPAPHHSVGIAAAALPELCVLALCPL